MCGELSDSAALTPRKAPLMNLKMDANHILSESDSNLPAGNESCPYSSLRVTAMAVINRQHHMCIERFYKKKKKQIMISI
jgi:hypothetical protein